MASLAQFQARVFERRRFSGERRGVSRDGPSFAAFEKFRDNTAPRETDVEYNRREDQLEQSRGSNVGGQCLPNDVPNQVPIRDCVLQI